MTNLLMPGEIRKGAGDVGSSQAELRRALVVCPYFVPLNGADMHRVRTTLPFFREDGLEATVLALEPSNDDVTDSWLSETIGDDVAVSRVQGLSEKVGRLFGVRNQALRAFNAFRRAGDRIIRENKIEVIYFSTTAFPLLLLGRYWQRRHHVPYVIDLQDPWYTDYYDRKDSPAPPGGRLKFALSNGIARLLEPYVFKRACHVICVSAAYPQTLKRRYKWLRPDQFTVLPFGAAVSDFERSVAPEKNNSLFDPNDGCQHWVYVGVAPGSMRHSLAAFFRAFAEARRSHPHRLNSVQLHFIGTSYADRARAQPSVLPIAREFGVADAVREHPTRIPYSSALHAIKTASALLIPGSDEEGYTPSKLYPYVLARKPLLAILRDTCGATSFVQSTQSAVLVTFRPNDSIEDTARRILQQWFASSTPPSPGTDWTAFEPYTAREVARVQNRILHSCGKEREQ